MSNDKLYLSVLRGRTPSTARAVITSEDQDMIRSLLAQIHRYIPGMDSNRALFDDQSVFPSGRRTTRWQRRGGPSSRETRGET